ncbi:MAG: protein tolB [Desulfovibrionaceae bacterium]
MLHRLLLPVCLLTLLWAVPAGAQLTVDIYGPGQNKVTLAILPARSVSGGALPAVAAKFEEQVRQDLSFLPFIKVVKTSEILGGDPSRGLQAQDIDFRPLILGRVDLVMTSGWEGGDIQARVFETLQSRRLVGKAYRGLDDRNVGKAADAFCAELMRALTGRSGFFNTTIAFVRKMGESSELYTISPQGRDLTRITNVGGFNLSPEWSKDGRRILYTHVGEREHSLGVWDKTTGRSAMYRFPGHTVISPAFMHDGAATVVLNMTGSPDVWLLDKAYKPVRILVGGRAIEVSQTFDSKGLRMAYVSDRLGNPHIFAMDLGTGQETRVTYEGSYNTNPCLSPDGRYVAFSRQMSGGHRIFVHDLMTGQERQITFGPGSDEDPAFGPDGYFVAFCSSRGGGYKLYLTTRHGDDPMLIPTGPGEASMPAWDTSRTQ